MQVRTQVQVQSRSCVYNCACDCANRIVPPSSVIFEDAVFVPISPRESPPRDYSITRVSSSSSNNVREEKESATMLCVPGSGCTWIRAKPRVQSTRVTNPLSPSLSLVDTINVFRRYPSRRGTPRRRASRRPGVRGDVRRRREYKRVGGRGSFPRRRGRELAARLPSRDSERNETRLRGVCGPVNSERFSFFFHRNNTKEGKHSDAFRCIGASIGLALSVARAIFTY